MPRGAPIGIFMNNIFFKKAPGKNKLTQIASLFDKKRIILFFQEINGHFVLRTPVRHCELNPIELIWGTVKRAVANRNTTFRIRDVERLVHEE